jgi:hypothetical protein
MIEGDAIKNVSEKDVMELTWVYKEICTKKGLESEQR